MSLQANNLTFKYFKNTTKPVIENLDFTVEKGTITLLTGKSGSGKSTLGYLLSGLYPESAGFLTSGKICIDGVDITQLTPNQRVPYVTMMFQNPDLQFCMNNLEQELAFCLENIAVPEADIPVLTTEAIDFLKLEPLRTQPFHTLSGGQKQKCALCCILALNSQYIILDEAFANIDPQSTKELIGMLRQMNVTVLAIDHNIDLWEGHYDQLISLDGSAAKVFDLKLDLPHTDETIITATALQVNGIDYPDIEIKKGSINAVVGASGSGKSTFFKTLIKQHPYKGSLRFNQQEVAKTRRKRLFNQCGIVFQNPANQFLALTTYDEVLFSVKRWYKDKNTQWQDAKTMELLRMFKLDTHKKYSPYMLSGGQQRRLAVLSMIAGSQDVLMLDEPTYGQDYENMCAMMQLLKEKAATGLTIIFATHNMQIAQQFSHQLITIGGEKDV
ncbi:MAG: energy-coupling factor ABC transporter ATP-binding protein [Defluviitaleaceae bacterium]|nr:energy-coupling factor ABC transporter ATP-binding protein [Defluviitaleaceae bacterium]